MKSRKPSYYLVLFATFFAVCVVVLGAYTRLKDAGLGCPDWPGCYGFAGVPETAAQISQAEELYPHAPFEADKAWPEVIHRYFAGGLGLLIVLINISAWRNRHRREQPFKLPVLLLILVIAQGLFGMWTVTLRLWPQVVTTHLLGGFATLSLLWLLVLRLNNTPWPYPNIPIRRWLKLKPLAMLGLILVTAQIALGGWTSSNYAALACPDLPTCHNRWLPPMDMASGFNIFQEIGPNYLGGQLEGEARVAIHFGHRVGALVVALYLLFLLVLLHRHAGGRHLKTQANIIAVLLVIQLCLGLSNVIWKLPLWVAVAHNAGAALLLLSLVTLNYRLRKTTANAF
ncbi:MAG: COX15/CtaA family protein [Pseudomonadales bacterium]|nr:COX15/CtaA family protein [Pseudomonadales bacterium]